MIKKLYGWMGARVHSPQAPLFLGLLSFFESLILPPVAPILVLFCIENRNKSFFYAALVTITSVLGGMVAYFIGFGLWQTIGQKLVLYFSTQQAFNSLVAHYAHYEALVVLVGSFVPVPYRLISLGAGFCKLAFLPFVIYSFIGRGARYFLVALTLYFWGENIKFFIDRWFNYLVLLFVALVILGVLLFFKT
jgi:membrane protein YqaA with SNARE-associated domain